MSTFRPSGAGRRSRPSDDRPSPRRQSYFRRPSSEGATSPGDVVEGIVKWFDTDRGFGFVELAGGAGNAFLHASVLEARRLRFPQPGARLRGRAGQGPKGLQITEVVEIAEEAPPAEPVRREPRGPRSVAQPSRGTTASSARSPGVPMLGTMKWFDAGKGFGFVGVEDGGDDVFLHASVLKRTGMADPTEGQRVMILVIQGAKGREAVSIAPVD